MIENILRYSLKYRYFMLIITLLFVIFAGYCLQYLTIDAVPDITNNQVQINTVAASFSPEEVEKQITFHIENSLAGIVGLQSTRSISRNGFSQVTAIFDDDIDIYFARAQVNERLNDAQQSLPLGISPKMGPISTGLGEIYSWIVEYEKPNIDINSNIIAQDSQNKQQNAQNGGWQLDGNYVTPEGQILQNETERIAYLRTIQDWVIRPQLKSVKGVAGTEAIGGYIKQYHIAPNPDRMVALGLGFADVIAVLERNNLGIGASYIEQGGEALAVRSDGRIKNIKQIGDIVVAKRSGMVIYLRDIATINIAKQLRSGSASRDGKEVVLGTVFMRIGENSRIVAQAVDEKMQQINQLLPVGIKAKTVMNRSKLVDKTINTVRTNLIEGALLVMVILFAMLGNFRAALIAALVIPLAMLMTAMGMIRLGISGNLMSLGALDFGIIIDGAVIIVENCLCRLSAHQHENGYVSNLQERMKQVMQASIEMIKPALFGQLIIIMVYLPLLSLTGVEGKMFSPMAITVILALIAAFVLSVTFVPAMVAIFVSGELKEHDNKIIERSKSGYETILRKLMQFPAIVAMFSLGGFMVALWLFSNMGQEFMPSLDEGDIAMHAMRIPSTSLDLSQKLQFQVEQAASNVPEVELVFSKTGTGDIASDPAPVNVSDTFIIMKNRSEWQNPTEPKQQIIERIRAEVAKVPANNYEFSQPIEMRFSELISGVRSDLAVKIYGDEFAPMLQSAKQIAKILSTIEGAVDVKIEQTDGLPFLDIIPDKKAIARYGLNVSDVLDLVQIAIGGKQAGLIFDGDRRFEMIVRLPDSMRNDLVQLGNLPLLLPIISPLASPLISPVNAAMNNPAFVPLKQLAKLTIIEGINQISRENGHRRVVVQANMQGRDIASFVAEAKQKIANQVQLPVGYFLEWDGQFKNLQQATQRLAVVVPMVFVMILLLLYVALRSLAQSLLVFSAVPLALTGGIIALWLCALPFSISAAVGMIALSGIAVLNGLVLITLINQLIDAGMDYNEAIIAGAVSRFRPVVMTALVASLGFVPMAIATGAGAEVQKPLAIVVIGGIITATILTLIVVPTFYKYLRFNR